MTECDAPVVGASVEVHSSGGNKYGPKTTDGGGWARFSVIGGTNRLWYAIVNGTRMGPTVQVPKCGDSATIEVIFPCVPTPVPTVVEVLGVERLPVTGGAPLPVWPFPGLMSITSFALIGTGLVLRRFEK